MERVTTAATVRVFQQWAERKMLAGQNGLGDAIRHRTGAESNLKDPDRVSSPARVGTAAVSEAAQAGIGCRLSQLGTNGGLRASRIDLVSPVRPEPVSGTFSDIPTRRNSKLHVDLQTGATEDAPLKSMDRPTHPRPDGDSQIPFPPLP